MILYHMKWYHMIWYHNIWYDMTSYHMIWYRSRGRNCRRGRGLAMQWKTWNFFQELYPGKMTFKKHQKYKKEPRENSVHFHCWIITRSFFSNHFRRFSIFMYYMYMAGPTGRRSNPPLPPPGTPVGRGRGRESNWFTNPTRRQVGGFGFTHTSIALFPKQVYPVGVLAVN